MAVMAGYRFDKKTTTEECLELSIFYLQRNKLLKSEGSFILNWGENSISAETLKRGSQAFLCLSYTKDKENSINHIIPLTATPLPWGKEKYWFICCLEKNGKKCGRRVAKLYLPPGGRYFGCRHCYSLTYKSAQEHYQKADQLAKNPLALSRAINTGNLSIAVIRALGKSRLL